jgi:hypothetical protein
VLEQDYPYIEYLIIDGGSTDGSVEIIRRYADRLAGWVSEPDRGQTDAINKGFGLAKGEILAWLNSDDVYLPGAVGEAVDYLLAHPEAGMVYGDANLVDEKGQVIGRFPARQTDYRRLRRGYVHIPQQAAFFRASLWQQVGPLDPTFYFAMDYDLWVRLARLAPLHYTPRLWANFRLHGGGKSVISDDRCSLRCCVYREGCSWFSVQTSQIRTHADEPPSTGRSELLNEITQCWQAWPALYCSASGLLRFPRSRKYACTRPPRKCSTPGWFPGLRAKDHTVFWCDGYYYLISTYVPPSDPSPAQTASLQIKRPLLWELPPRTDVPRRDEAAVWAPMFNRKASTTCSTRSTRHSKHPVGDSPNPADPPMAEEGLVFQPSHPGALWEAGGADRDPYVMKHAGQYYLYYTGQTWVGVIAVTADSRQALDRLGSIVSPTGTDVESPFALKYDQLYYRFYNQPKLAIIPHGSSPTGVWQEAIPFYLAGHMRSGRRPGKLDAYTTDYSVTIAHLIWADYNNIPRPMIEGSGRKLFLPLVRK